MAETAIRVLYTAEATADDGRDGNVTSSDGRLSLKVATPRELGGAGGQGTNPEQLFAAGYAACFHSALKLVGRSQRLSTGGCRVTAKVGIGPNDSGAFQLTVALVVSLPDVPRASAEELVARAHAVCPYSNATRGNIDVTLSLD